MRGVQTAEIAAAKAAHKVQEGAAAAYEVTKQKAGEAYASTAEYLKEKVLPANSHPSLDLCNMEASKVLWVWPLLLHACLRLPSTVGRLYAVFMRFVKNFGFLAAHSSPYECLLDTCVIICVCIV